MTNREAKEKLYMEWQKFLEDNIDYAGISEAYKMAFRALEKESTVIGTGDGEYYNIETCRDVISRQAVLNGLSEITRYGILGVSKESDGVWYKADEVEKMLKNLQSVKQQTGHWILKIEDWNRWTCSECGYTKRTDIHVSLGYDFCPKCGARMGEKQNG